MQKRKVVSRQEWLAARREHLAKEKDFTRARDALSLASTPRRLRRLTGPAGVGRVLIDAHLVLE